MCSNDNISVNTSFFVWIHERDVENMMTNFCYLMTDHVKTHKKMENSSNMKNLELESVVRE